MGVELATMLPNGTTTYNPDNIDLALVVPTYLELTGQLLTWAPAQVARISARRRISARPYLVERTGSSA